MSVIIDGKQYELAGASVKWTAGIGRLQGQANQRRAQDRVRIRATVRIPLPRQQNQEILSHGPI